MCYKLIYSMITQTLIDQWMMEKYLLTILEEVYQLRILILQALKNYVN